MNAPRAPRWNPFRRTSTPRTSSADRTAAQAAGPGGRPVPSAHARMAGDVIDATHHALLAEVDAHHERVLAEADAAIAYLQADTTAAEAQLAAQREAEDAQVEADRLAQQDSERTAADVDESAQVLPSMSQAVQDAVADLETHKGRPVTAPEVRWLAHVLADIDTAEQSTSQPAGPGTRAAAADEAAPPPPAAADENVDEDGTTL